MSIATYSDLVGAVGDWLDRDDLAARAPDFIALAEARLNRLLDDPDMELTATTVASGASTTLPDDFGSMVSISTGSGRHLSAMSAVDFSGIDQTISGTPRFYCLVDGSITFAPADAAATITMVYRRTIPALTATNTTNWLLTRAPDVYLYASLVQASAFIAEDDRLPVWKGALDEAIEELMRDGQKRRFGSAPVAPRIRRP